MSESVDLAKLRPFSPYLRRFSAWAKRVRLELRASIALTLAAVIAGFATFLAMTGHIPGMGDPQGILLLLTLDLVLLLIVGTLIFRRLVIVWVKRRRGVAGARLHSQLVGLFSLVAVTPTLIIAIFSVLLFDFGLQGWFSQRVSTAVRESLAVAESYLQEHRRTINADVLAMANDLNREGPTLMLSPQRFQQVVGGQAALRSLTEAMVFERSGRILARAGFNLLLDFDPQIPDWALNRANEGDVVILTADTEDRVRALMRLDAFPNAYLYVGRLVDPRVLAHMQRSSAAVLLYEQLEGERSGLIITFAVLFLVVAFMLLLAAAWVGLAFASRLTGPIERLIGASEQVGAGDLSVRVEEPQEGDEVGTLSRAFNRMTGQLQQQQTQLLAANQQVEERRRFIEAVLSGVSAGVVGLDRHQTVTIANRSACELLGISDKQLVGRGIGRQSRTVKRLLEKAGQRPGRVHEGQITLKRGRGLARTLLVRILAEQGEEGVEGFVVTFDDVTELMSAQRKAAWSDVARRIAHEIKNPLTPIQLSAERLKRKYLEQIKQDPETFQACTDTIVRQVGDIGRMVDEFSSFARMPTPAMTNTDLRALIDQALVLQRHAHGDITYHLSIPRSAAVASVDRAQLSQALTNLLQNAADSIEGRKEEETHAGSEQDPGEVWVELRTEADAWLVVIEDNGRGLPQEHRERLTEPYVTTREKGTGLGLAIVKKIMEDHGGDLKLSDRPGGGAAVTLVLPRASEKAEHPEKKSPRVREKAAANGK